MADFEVTQSSSGQWILSVSSRILRFNRQYYYATEQKLDAAKGAIEEAFSRREAAVQGKRPAPEPVVIPNPEPTMPASEDPLDGEDDWEITDPGMTFDENAEEVAAEVAASVTPEPEAPVEIADLEPYPEEDAETEDGSVPIGTAAEVLAWVESQPDVGGAAQHALAEERSGKQRKTLSQKLEAIIASSDEEE